MNPKNNNTNQIINKIGIIGMGPVGMILALHIKEAGFDVVICEKRLRKLKLIQKEGIFLENTITKQDSFNKFHSSIKKLQGEDLDLLIFSLKTHQMAEAVKEAAHLKNDNLCVMSAQNGIDSERPLAEVFSESKTMRMVINFAGNLQAHNRVNVTFFNPPNYIASIDDSQKEKVEAFSKILTGVKLETEVVDSFTLLRTIWGKTILNSSISAICAIGKFTIKEAMEMPEMVEIIEQVMFETVKVAEAEKIKFEDDFVRKCLTYLRNAGDHIPSLAEDLHNNRKTEIDYFNGKIVEYGRKHYIQTPMNLAFASMVKAITRKTLYDFLGKNQLTKK